MFAALLSRYIYSFNARKNYIVQNTIEGAVQFQDSVHIQKVRHFDVPLTRVCVLHLTNLFWVDAVELVKLYTCDMKVNVFACLSCVL